MRVCIFKNIYSLHLHAVECVRTCIYAHLKLGRNAFAIYLCDLL